jgi:hypothetical protein
MQPSIGRIVHYKLTQADAAAINKRRADVKNPGAGMASQIIVGNDAAEGQVCAATVVRTFGGPAANLQVHLDGTDTYWATSRTEGTEPGTWAWPPRT